MKRSASEPGLTHQNIRKTIRKKKNIIKSKNYSGESEEIRSRNSVVWAVFLKYGILKKMLKGVLEGSYKL